MSSFEELCEVFDCKAKQWLKQIVTDLPHVTLTHYMHIVAQHGCQLLQRDKGINIHSSSGIEMSHQRMKMDIRRHLGGGSWAKTLLVRWLMRTNREILRNTPISE